MVEMRRDRVFGFSLPAFHTRMCQSVCLGADRAVTHRPVDRDGKGLTFIQQVPASSPGRRQTLITQDFSRSLRTVQATSKQVHSNKPRRQHTCQFIFVIRRSTFH